MSDRITPDELRRAIATIVEEVRERPPRTLATEDVGNLLSASYVLMAALGTGLGECRQKTPFAPLRPVIDSGGTLKWCCSHDPEHCAS